MTQRFSTYLLHRCHRVCALITVAVLTCVLHAGAQNVLVNVTPVQPTLPPQVLLYVADPGKYFTLQLSNNTGVEEQVYLQLEVEHISPNDGLRIATPPNFQPPRPITIPANGVRQLTSVEMNALFDHIPPQYVSCPEGLFEDYQSGAFGLLPEGLYRGKIVAYKWASPALTTPVPVSNPEMGTCQFTVCYKAQAPFFLPAADALTGGEQVFEFGQPVQFSWTMPTITCGATSTYTYDLRIVELLDGQAPDDAIDLNPVAYQARKLVAPICIVPQNIINSYLKADRNYIAQITTHPATTSAMNYVMLENDGKSDIRRFRIKGRPVPPPAVDDHQDAGGDTPADASGDDDDDDDDDSGDDDDDDDDADRDYEILFGNTEIQDSISVDSLYTFRAAELIKPTFTDFGARRVYLGNDIEVSWKSVFFVGGLGQNPDELKFVYDVNLYKGTPSPDAPQTVDKEATLKTTPILTVNFDPEQDDTDAGDDDDDGYQTTLKWTDLEPLVQNQDYLVLQVRPRCINGSSIYYSNDSISVTDFAIVEHLTKSYFQCSNTVEIDNFEPTKLTVEELKGKTVAIGEYQLTLDNTHLEKTKDGAFKGKGKVEWNPLGTTVMVCVKFDSLRINTDDVVYGGECHTYAKDNALSDAEVVEKLFSDWGIDKFIGDSGLPYASAIDNAAKSKAKDLAKEIDLAKYYGYIQKGSALYRALGTGDIDELYLPVDMPDIVNKSPVKIQISTMKFAPTHATMDLIGEFALPNSNYLKNDILVFGAPRLCISPDQIIPESGTIALLSDFEIHDPKSSFDMKFKAPQDVLTPSDGCYISWHDYAFEMLGVDIDMKVPGLVKDVNGETQMDSEGNPERPILNIRASFSDWEDLLVDNVTIDNFQAESLPGWTFTARDIVYDHSVLRNSDRMAAFPSKYDRTKAGITGMVDYKGQKYIVDQADGDWQGLFIRQIGVEFPKSFQFSDKADDDNPSKRLSIQATDMFFDKSGVTLGAGVKDVFSAATGKLGGWAFSLDEVSLNFVQSNFDDCKIKGTLGVPLIKNTDDSPAVLAYECQIRKALREGHETDNTAYIFTIQQMEDEMNLDFFLAKAKFQKSLTYFAVEAETGSDDSQTRVELMMGGNLRIGGSDWMEGKLKDKLAIKVDIPDIHFSGLRIANCDVWTSEYANLKLMQEAARKDDTKTLLDLYGGKTFHNNAKTFYFSTGAWSLASMEKKVGPFEFSLKKFEILDDKDPLPAGATPCDLNFKLAIGGQVKLVKGLDISAEAYVALRFGMSGVTDFKNIDCAFHECRFDSCAVNTSFSGITIEGKLISEKSADREGLAGSIKVVLPGDIFKLDMKGGYYDEKAKGDTEAFTWGYFVIKMDGKAGIPIPPVQLSGITGGFYFNCMAKASSPDDVKPKLGCTGIIMGLTLSCIGSDDMFKGDFTVTVVYDANRDGKGKGGLTQFMFVGDMSAVAGMIHSKMTIIYENTQQDEYFQLNITVDASLDNCDALKALNAEFEEFTQALPQDLKNIEDAEKEGTPDENKTDGGKVVTKNKEQKATAELGKAKIELDIKVTFKEKGKKLNKVKWHVYLGEPDEAKRCSFVLIDFKSPIVTVTIGANAYVCVGNELPNDGQLPPIPDKIAKFLDGSENGATKSDGIGPANSARAAATANFGGSVAGGVMFGAQVYGYIDVNLGIISAGLDALAGFDISIRKLQGAVCTNTNGHPGWHEWYGQGQLYAYLAAWLNLHINLGFYKKDIEIASAAIGGVLRMGGPNPTYFDGRLRAKISALGGLIKFDKNFSFACGQSCDLFLGNPLDNFILFDYCTLGDTVRSEMWDTARAIDPVITKSPYMNTNAPIEQHFRVLDENEFQRISKDYGGDVEKLKIEAERTFIFRASDRAYLFEYDKESDYDQDRWENYRKDHESAHLAHVSGNNYAAYYNIPIKGSNPTHHTIDMATLRRSLKPNKFYRLEFNGAAYELQNGTEVDPVTFDTIQSKYFNRPWHQTKDFFFCTGESKAFADTCKLDQFIAVAYPSNYNTFHDDVKDADTDNYLPVYYHDAQAPTIALTQDISQTAYRTGKLYWRVLNTRGQELQRVENAWVTKRGQCNMEPRSLLTQMRKGQKYILSLDYATFDTDSEGGILSDTLNIGRLHISVVDADWRSGYKSKNLAYEVPFKATRLVSYTHKPYTTTNTADIYLALDQATYDGNVLLRNSNPFLYFSYLSNWAFIGGWETDNNKFHLDITTSQSAIMRVEGAGNFEGSFGDRAHAYSPATDNLATNIWDDHTKIRDMFFYDESQYSAAYGLWPLAKPTLTDYEYVLNSDERTTTFTPGANGLDIVAPVLAPIKAKYDAVQRFDRLVTSTLREYSTFNTADARSFTESQLIENANQWLELHRGTYLTTYETRDASFKATDSKGKEFTDFVRSDGADRQFITLPYYQIGFNGIQGMLARLHWVYPKIMKREHYRACQDVIAYTNSCLLGMNMECSDPQLYTDGTKHYYKDYLKQPSHSLMSDGRGFNADFAKAHVTNATIYAYRVNGYDFEKGEYVVRTDLMNGTGGYLYDVKDPLTDAARILSTTPLSSNTGTTSTGIVTGQTTMGAAGTGSAASGGTAYETEVQNIVNCRNVVTDERNKSSDYYDTAFHLVDTKNRENANYINTLVHGCLQNVFGTNDMLARKGAEAAPRYLTQLDGYRKTVATALSRLTSSLTNATSYQTSAETSLATIQGGLGAKDLIRVTAERDVEVIHAKTDAMLDERTLVADYKHLIDSLYDDAKVYVDKIPVGLDPDTDRKASGRFAQAKSWHDQVQEFTYRIRKRFEDGGNTLTSRELADVHKDYTACLAAFEMYKQADDRDKRTPGSSYAKVEAKGQAVLDVNDRIHAGDDLIDADMAQVEYGVREFMKRYDNVMEVAVPEFGYGYRVDTMRVNVERWLLQAKDYIAGYKAQTENLNEMVADVQNTLNSLESMYNAYYYCSLYLLNYRSASTANLYKNYRTNVFEARLDNFAKSLSDVASETAEIRRRCLGRFDDTDTWSDVEAVRSVSNAMRYLAEDCQRLQSRYDSFSGEDGERLEDIRKNINDIANNLRYYSARTDDETQAAAILVLEDYEKRYDAEYRALVHDRDSVLATIGNPADTLALYQTYQRDLEAFSTLSRRTLVRQMDQILENVAACKVGWSEADNPYFTTEGFLAETRERMGYAEDYIQQLRELEGPWDDRIYNTALDVVMFMNDVDRYYAKSESIDYDAFDNEINRLKRDFSPLSRDYHALVPSYAKTANLPEDYLHRADSVAAVARRSLDQILAIHTSIDSLREVTRTGFVGEAIDEALYRRDNPKLRGWLAYIDEMDAFTDTFEADVDSLLAAWDVQDRALNDAQTAMMRHKNGEILAEEFQTAYERYDQLRNDYFQLVTDFNHMDPEHDYMTPAKRADIYLAVVEDMRRDIEPGITPSRLRAAEEKHQTATGRLSTAFSTYNAFFPTHSDWNDHIAWRGQDVTTWNFNLYNGDPTWVRWNEVLSDFAKAVNDYGAATDTLSAAVTGITDAYTNVEDVYAAYRGGRATKVELAEAVAAYDAAMTRHQDAMLAYATLDAAITVAESALAPARQDAADSWQDVTSGDTLIETARKRYARFAEQKRLLETRLSTAVIAGFDKTVNNIRRRL